MVKLTLKCIHYILSKKYLNIYIYIYMNFKFKSISKIKLNFKT